VTYIGLLKGLTPDSLQGTNRYKAKLDRDPILPLSLQIRFCNGSLTYIGCEKPSTQNPCDSSDIQLIQNNILLRFSERECTPLPYLLLINYFQNKSYCGLNFLEFQAIIAQVDVEKCQRNGIIVVAKLPPLWLWFL